MERVKSAGRERISAVKGKKGGSRQEGEGGGRNRICIARAFFFCPPFSREKYVTKRDIDPFESSVYWLLLLLWRFNRVTAAYFFSQTPHFLYCRKTNIDFEKKNKKHVYPCSEEKYSDLIKDQSPLL